MDRPQRSPTHGIVRGSGPCQHCGIRAWKWRPTLKTHDGNAELLACCLGCDTPFGQSGTWILCPSCKCVSADPAESITASADGDDTLHGLLTNRCYHCPWTA